MKVGPVELPTTLTYDSHTLTLNGAGLRKLMLLKVYVGGLYLSSRSADASAIIQADEPMGIRLHFVLKSVPRTMISESIRLGFSRVTGGNTAPLQDKIDGILQASFGEALVRGDCVDLVYLPQRGIVCYKNGDDRGEISGLDFKRVVFSIWLGSQPGDKGLKKALLGA